MSPLVVAALYDIHGNLPALDAVLAEVEETGVDGIVVGGDVVPGPEPRACLERLLELPVPVRFIRGNGERDVLAAARGAVPARVPERFHEVLHWVVGRLEADGLEVLGGWPPTTGMGIPPLGRVLFCHATPRDDNEIFTRATPEATLRPVFEPTGADVVICGHTHMAFDRKVGSVRVVNAGSVGMPFGGPEARWALLGPDVDLRRTVYDVDAAAARIAGSGYPGADDFDVRRPPSEARMLTAFEAVALR